MTRLREKIIYFFRIIASVAIFSLLVYTVGFTFLIDHITDISLIPLFYAVLFNFFYLLISVLSIWILLAHLYRHSFSVFFKCYIYALVVNFFFPGQIGDFSIVYFLKRYEVPTSSVSASYIIDKLSNLIVYCIVAWYGINLIFFKVDIVYLLGFSAIAFMGLVLIFVFLKLLQAKVKRIDKVMVLIKKIKQEITLFRKYWYLLILNFTCSVIKWITFSFYVKYAFQALNQTVPWPEVGVGPIIAALVGYIPITVGGIGTVEYSAIYVFEQIGITGSVVLTTYLLMRSIQYLQAGLLLLYLQLFHRDGRLSVSSPSS